ncbi:MAG: hypothetical protein IBX39_01875 [Candidatus Methanoperedenaceae archaeon]|nr:hypothetical protein [Candidatus Methanoperedenaceae archaeon]
MNDENEYLEIKMSAGWFLTVSKQTSDKFGDEKEYIEIAKERSGQKRARFNLNPKYVRALGEALVKFADDNSL